VGRGSNSARSAEFDARAWRRLHTHFRDPEIAHLNGTPPSRMPLWLLRRVLRADAARPDRRTFGVFDERRASTSGTIELYDLRGSEATLGIIIGERSHWGRGYGGDAMRTLLAYAFEEIGLERVRLHTFGDNERAQAAFHKVGFVESSDATNVRGRVDMHMSLTRTAWFGHRGTPRLARLRVPLPSPRRLGPVSARDPRPRPAPGSSARGPASTASASPPPSSASSAAGSK
jgi:RimJ/RimL family protein N-acetyltransferase